MNNIPKIVLENPFRILGVFANATKKEIVANQGKANAFLKVGRPVEYPLDLGKLMPSVNRSVDIFSQANAHLTIAKEQLKYAQFWFLKMTPLDDVAFNHLYAGNWQQAIEIWDKKNCVSSLQNKVVTNFITNNFDQAVNTAEDLYDQFSDDFLKAADTTGTLNLDKDDLIHSFIDTLCAEYEPKRIYDIVFSDDWKDYLGSKTVTPIIDRVKAAIKEAKDVDSDDANANLSAGIKLQNTTKKDLAQLKAILPSDDPQLESIADKLGLQILQCAINYYNNSDHEVAAENAMTLQKEASKIVMGEMAKDRCEENMKVLEKIIADLPPKEVRKEHDAVMAEIEKIIKKSPSISNADSLLNNCKPHIQAIKTKLGSTNEHYLKLSTIVVSVAMRMVVGDVNEAQETAHDKIESCFSSYDRNRIVEKLKTTLRAAWNVTLSMDDYDIESDFKSHYNQNRSALKSMCEDWNISTYKPITRTTTSTTSSSTRTTTIPRTRTAAAVSTPKPSSSSTSSSSSSVSSSTTTPTNPPKSAEDDDKIDWGIVLFIHIVYGFMSFIPGFGERHLNPILNFLLGVFAGGAFWVLPLNVIAYKIIKWIKKQMNS